MTTDPSAGPGAPAAADDAREVREGQELDTSSLEAFLKASLGGLEGRLRIRQFPGGHSNLTYLLSFENRDMVLRRPPFGLVGASAHDMVREHTVLEALGPAFPLAPKPLLFSDDSAVIGCPFYVMERVEGVIIRRTLPEGMSLSSDQARRLAHNMIEALHALHSLDHRAIGLDDFGKPDGYVQRQVEGWIDRYREARTPDVPDGEEVMAWLRDNVPPDSARPSIVHGDWKTDNVVLDRGDPTRIVAVLDWEMATIGDPAMDLAYALIFFDERRAARPVGLSAALPPIFAEAVSREELLELYQQLSGQAIENPDFYYAFNMFRLGGLLQQLYARFYRGHSRDERYQGLKVMVQVILSSAQQVVDRTA